MAVISNKDQPAPAYLETVEEIMKTYKSLPPRSSIQQLEAAISVINTANSQEKLRLDEINNQVEPEEVPPELFSILQQVRKTMALFQSLEQSKEALMLIELDKFHQTFDDLIQRASHVVSGGSQVEIENNFEDPVEKEVKGEEEGLLMIKKREGHEQEKEGKWKGLMKGSSTKAITFSSGDGEAENSKLSLMKVASLIENTAKTGDTVLDLEGKLMDNIEWIPVSLGKLAHIVEINLSNNKIMALPTTISNLTTLKKLDIHANQLINLPNSFGELINLSDLDLHANRLKSLPASFGNLTNLLSFDLSSNLFSTLPDLIGKLTSLKLLNVETNELIELPYTIGSCSSLVELRLDFNQLRGFPEALGKLELLEILTFHYNRVGRLPTTMGNLTNLRELDASFNELESIPESLCFAVNLEKLNVGKNFADLRDLPRSIGNLEKLEMIDISDDQIRVLPDSFGLLKKLRVFHAYETPLEVPPRQVVALGAQAVVQYMADFVAKRDAKSPMPTTNKKGFWSCLCCLLFWK